MIGVLAAILTTVSAIGFSNLLLRRWTADFDLCARLGITGLTGLGAFGTLLYFLGWISIPVAFVAVAVCAVIGLALGLRDLRWWGKVELKTQGTFIFVIGLGFLFALIGVLAPSTVKDWDSLAYHLAVPKMWLQAGKVEVIPFIHQSNFPFAIDSLYLIGLQVAGQAGAKAFSWLIGILGVITIFGIARQRYGATAAWWSALSFSTIPIVLWQTGTGYIDVGHGLFSGLGLLLACKWIESNDRRDLVIAAVLLGFGLGTKYTGMQTLGVTGILVIAGVMLTKRSTKPIWISLALALAIGAPWYVKNVVTKDNPVFPFFYGKLGGKEWDERRAEIYTHEQNTFGVGRTVPATGSVEPLRLGHSVLGLAYQPGRYVNPQQDVGNGDPLGSIGLAFVAGLTLLLIRGRHRPMERYALIGVLVSLGIWFVLTQQSRYIVTLAVPVAVMIGQLWTHENYRRLAAGAIAIQSAVGLYLAYALPGAFSDQIQVVMGKVTPDEYQSRNIAFYVPAKSINQLGPSAKVALYDELFGYLLDVPYWWGNPGHSTRIPYDSMLNGEDFVREMRKLGFTHAYLNLRAQDPALSAKLTASLQGQPLDEVTHNQLMANWQVKFLPLIVDAVATGHMRVSEWYGNPQAPKGVLMEFEK